VKKVIELLEEAFYQVSRSDSGYKGTRLGRALDAIEEAITILKTPPRWETPEQRKERTGEEWPENALVYYRYAGARETYEGIYYDEFGGEWGYAAYKRIRGFAREAEKHKNGRYQIVCANEAGPPPDDWKPEEAQ
jgi:hypothetical protein